MMTLHKGEECSVIKINTPDGKMFVTIIERENSPAEIQVFIGKTGTQIRAWTDAVQLLASLALKHGASLSDLVTTLSMVTSHKTVYHAGVIPIRSGPEGLSYAIRKYLTSLVKAPESYKVLPFIDQDRINNE